MLLGYNLTKIILPYICWVTNKHNDFFTNCEQLNVLSMKCLRELLVSNKSFIIKFIIKMALRSSYTGPSSAKLKKINKSVHDFVDGIEWGSDSQPGCCNALAADISMTCPRNFKQNKNYIPSSATDSTPTSVREIICIFCPSLIRPTRTLDCQVPS